MCSPKEKVFALDVSILFFAVSQQLRVAALLYWFI